MKKSIIAAGLATVLAATSFAGSATADPFGRYPPRQPQPTYHHYRHHHHRDFDPGPAIVAGAVFGMIGAALADSYQQPYYGYAGPRSHTAWCEWRYKTYNPATDLFYARPGVQEYCHSPYD